MRETIPKDLKWLADECKEGKTQVVRFIKIGARTRKTILVSVLGKLLERIAKAEARNKVLEEAAKSALSALAWLPEDKGPVRQRVQQVIVELRAALREDR